MQFVVASHNHDKIEELQRIFRVCNNEVISYTDLLPKIKFPPEGNRSYEKNASDKALFISKLLPDRLVIADDSGLLLTARPEILGVRTARDLTDYPTPHQYAQHIIRLVQGKNRTFIMQTSIACAHQGKIIKVVDGTLLIVRQGFAEKEGVRQAVELLKHVNAYIVGTVLNDVDASTDGYYGYYGYGKEK